MAAAPNTRGWAGRTLANSGWAKLIMDEKQVPERIRSESSEVVLLVAGEDMVRNLAHMILEESGYVVLEAHDGREGLALCAGHQGPIDLLVTDLTIAELDAHELAERALKLRPGLKVLFLSDRTEDVALKESIVLKERIRAGGAFLQKPFTPVGLAEKVREALDSKAPAPNDHRN